MIWSLDKNRPLCPQICEQICVSIANGTFLPGSRLMSVREMAISAGVNPNTVQRANDCRKNVKLFSRNEDARARYRDG